MEWIENNSRAESQIVFDNIYIITTKYTVALSLIHYNN